MEIIQYLLITFVVILFFTTISYTLYDNIYEHLKPSNITSRKKKIKYKKYKNRGKYNKTCPSGCVFTGNKHDSISGYACPNGPFCYNNKCCKYDFQCKKCGKKLE
jgi:hypothetical protein